VAVGVVFTSLFQELRQQTLAMLDTATGEMIRDLLG
jgi:hypothetical protein